MARNRELIEPRSGDKRYVRRDAQGKFKEEEKVGRSLAQDQRRQSKTKAKKGAADRGDRRQRRHTPADSTL